MTPNQQRILAAAIAAAIWGGGSAAQAQTIVNLTNLDPTTTSGYGLPTTSSSNASTSLDLLNTTTALSNGGLFPGAVSTQSQAAYNQLNTIGINANGTVSPVVLGNQTPVAGTPNMVEINTITSAYNGVGAGSATLNGSSSSTINNINAAISSAVNPIIGAAAGVNNPWTGGYGGAASGAAVTANQVGVNSINGVGAAFADGTNVALSQLPGAPQPAPAITGTLTLTGTGAGTIPSTVTIGGITYTVTGATLNGAASTTGAVTANGSNVELTLSAATPTYGPAGAPGTTVTALSGFTAGTPALTQASASPAIVQGGSLNMSTVNTLLASATAGTVGINGNNGVDASGNPVRGNQTAVNTFNASTLVGTNLAVGAQQLADGLNVNQSTMASINRALAYSPGSQSANIDPSVTNLNQTASVGVNALNLQQAGTTATNATLSGLQSTGFNTNTQAYAGGNVMVGGATAIPVVTNQIVASTVGAGGFMPTGGTSSTDWAAFSSTLASGMPQPGSAGYPGATTTGTNTSAFLGGSFNPNVTGATNPYTTLNAGTVSVASANQAINLTNNTVSAGSAASPVNVTFGPAGFEQRTGTVGIATNAAGAQPSLAVGLGAGVTSPGGLSNAQALTGVGSSSISNLGQSFQTANNTFQGSGNVTGSMTQSASGIAFNAANIESGTGSAAVAAVNGGSGMIGPVVAPATTNNSTGYTLDSSVNGTNSALNNAVAGAVYGPVSLSSVAQSGTTYANVAAATGTIDTAASGTLAQNLGNITNYSGVQNAAVANSVASGNVAVTGTTQSLGVTGNAVQAAAINGSIAQLAEGSSSYNGASYSDAAFGARNAVLASSGSGQLIGQGSAVLNSTTQTNTSTLNAIQSAGALGSSTVPAALSQQSGTVNTQLGNSAFSSTVTSGQQNLAMAAPSNLAVVQATNGAGGSATANNTVQTAGLSVNSLSGGTAAGTGITGMATQVSYGQATSIGNQALAYAANAPRGDASLTGGTGVAGNAAVGSTMLGAQGVMSGNAALTNQQQLATQSLNTMALAGANNGNLNQATFGATNQTTGNQLYAQSNGGYALTTGAQTATNAVNVITAR
jgi:hypothetical protein